MEPLNKRLADLNLLDRFLFAEAMGDPVIMTAVLEIILGKEIILKYLPQTEKEERTSPLKKFIKLDVWATDINNTVYDAEVQKKDTKNIPRRSRLYQGLIDSRLLSPGEVDFNSLSNAFIIMIMPFDIFGKGAYQYTFKMQCNEYPDVCLEDGAVRIFLNTHGTNRTEVSDELVELLTYMEHTDKYTSQHCESKKIQDMQQRIERIKSTEEIGVRYMQQWEELVMERRQGIEEGIEKGKAEGQYEKLVELVKKKVEKGKSIDIIAEELEENVAVIKNLMAHLDI